MAITDNVLRNVLGNKKHLKCRCRSGGKRCLCGNPAAGYIVHNEGVWEGLGPILDETPACPIHLEKAQQLGLKTQRMW